MRKHCLLPSLALLAFLVAPNLPAQFSYSTNGGAITLTSYTGAGGAVTISNFVTSIGGSAFNALVSPQSRLITSLTIPNSVTNIGAEAFESCSQLTTLTLGANVETIGGNAFTSCGNLTAIAFPNSATNIGSTPLYDCTNLTSITVGTENPLYSSAGGVWFDKAQQTLLQFPGGLGGTYAIPGTVTAIGNEAMWNCVKLTGVSIPASVTNIGYSPFDGCTGLLNITVDPLNTVCRSVGGVLFDNTQTTLLNYPGGRVGSYTLPNSVTSVGAFSFAFCYGLTNLIVPAGVTNLQNFAFEDCYYLTNILFEGNAPAYLGTYVFFYCTNTTAYYLPGATGWNTFSGPPTVLWNPSINTTNGNLGIDSNQFNFTITGTANIPIVVEACTNLSNPAWVPLQTSTLTNGSISFSDAAATNYPRRFYSLFFP